MKLGCLVAVTAVFQKVTEKLNQRAEERRRMEAREEAAFKRAFADLIICCFELNGTLSARRANILRIKYRIPPLIHKKSNS